MPELPLLVPQAVPLLQLTTATLVLLYAPKLLATVVLLAQPARVKEHGGIGGVARSVVLESLFATLFAPVAMLAHSWFLLNIVVGRATGWTTQARSDRALPLLVCGEEFLAAHPDRCGRHFMCCIASRRKACPGSAAADGIDPGHSPGGDHAPA